MNRVAKYCLFTLVALLAFSENSMAQSISKAVKGNLEMIYIGKRYNYLVPHVVNTHSNAMNFHNSLWSYDYDKTYVMLTDFEDSGHGGAIVMPFNLVVLGIEPYSFAFNIIPSNERFQWLFNHELTHIVMADKANSRDLFFRDKFGGKVLRSEEQPISAFWSYLTTPRWYSPRWFHEGIATFMETWMSGGLGRAMGPYDEMYFRAIVEKGEPLYSLIGLETEGTTIDFQVGANSYLYGTRFVTYLAYKYGVESLKELFSRSEASKAFYANQFKSVYNKSVKQAWEEWRVWEYDFQNKNIEAISEYPITELNRITDKPLGNVSRLYYDSGRGKIYAAINHPGILSQVAEIDVKTGKTRKIASVDSPQMYYTTHIAYDKNGGALFITEQNSKFRNLVKVDIDSGKKRVINSMTRTGDIVFNSKDRSIWGVQNDNGYSTLVRIPEPYNTVVPIYTLPFGKTLFDLDISPSGEKLVATLSGIKGEQTLILLNLNDAMQGRVILQTLAHSEDNTFGQFRFTSDEKAVTGTSYYTGVSNIWSVNLSDKKMEMLTNTKSGLFSPVQLSSDSLLALQYHRDGMMPVLIKAEPVTNANSIEYLGHLAIEKNSELEEWSLPPAGAKSVGDTISYEKSYLPVKEMRFAYGYPDISGFKRSMAVGYNFKWTDPAGLSVIDLYTGISPWSSYSYWQKIHLALRWKYMGWELKANLNPVNFYDLFGPIRRSRAGYSVGIEYYRNFSFKQPLKREYRVGLTTYGLMEVLPFYQNVESPIKSMQSLHGIYTISKLRTTLGGVGDETGYSWSVSSTNYLANGKLFPSLVSSQDFGILVPWFRNTSFWIRSSIGKSFGDNSSGLSKFYFGGFRNNYIDWQPSEQYRNALAFPGAEIDEIPANSYIKTMGELNITPLRLKGVGTTWLYPTYIKPMFFASHLVTDPLKRESIRNIFNFGGQVDIQLVMFSYFKTTWSFGYARLAERGEVPKGQFMISLKLLGN